jgi:hypothetical protein
VIPLMEALQKGILGEKENQMSSECQGASSLEVLVKYRIMGETAPPRPIRIKRPGWAGAAQGPADGVTPQPWHCLPFADGSTYGLELIYSLSEECRVSSANGKIEFEADFSVNKRKGSVWPPFLSTNPGHYSMGTFIDIELPPGWVLRIEPHPRFFTDASGEVPAAVIGHLQTTWWPMFFFVTFKSPRPGETHVFKPGATYAQIIPVPENTVFKPQAMTEAEVDERESLAKLIMRHRGQIAKRKWKSADGLSFDDVYKQLNSVGRGNGTSRLKHFLEQKSKE